MKAKTNMTLHEYILCAKSYGFKTELIETARGSYLRGNNPFYRCEWSTIQTRRLSTNVARNAFNDL